MKNQLPSKPRNKREIYLDHAATTPIALAVLSTMKSYLKKEYGNPSSLHDKGVSVQKAITQARTSIASMLHTQSDNLIFTGNGTESCNMAILGLARAYKDKGKHIITSAIEHHAVLGPLKQLEKEGFEITYLPVSPDGLVSIFELKKAFRKDTILVSIMFANNEIGTIQPIADIGREILKWRKEYKTIFPYFHSDACQATLTQELKVDSLHTDLLSINSSKIYGPKGVGLLYKRKNIKLEPLMFGGGQETNLRPGTENVPGIIGFSKAIELVQKNKIKNTKQIMQVRNYFWNVLKKNISELFLNGSDLNSKDRLVSNLSVSFSGVDADKLILYLDAYGIYCSAGSACTSEKTDVSHVLKACGYNANRAKNSVRFTLGNNTTKKDINYVMKFLPGIVENLRAAQ